jgi:xanthine dehydrogenase small subunit
LPLGAFYRGYRETALAPGEFVASVRIPKRAGDVVLRAYKISKRYDQDISAVFACFALSLAAGRVERARIGCGGVAPTPVRARRTEALLTGAQWDRATVERAAESLRDEFSPIDDFRASAAYRRNVLGNLLLRCWLETTGAQGAPTRIETPAWRAMSGAGPSQAANSAPSGGSVAAKPQAWGDH